MGAITDCILGRNIYKDNIGVQINTLPMFIKKLKTGTRETALTGAAKDS